MLNFSVFFIILTFIYQVVSQDLVDSLIPEYCIQNSQICSNNGFCDLNSSVCVCNDGYTGEMCDRFSPTSTEFSIGVLVTTSVFFSFLFYGFFLSIVYMILQPNKETIKRQSRFRKAYPKKVKKAEVFLDKFYEKNHDE